MEGITVVFNHAVINRTKLSGAAPWLTLLPSSAQLTQGSERFDPKHSGTALD